MKQRKLHISPRLLLGVTVLLVAGCLVAAVGVGFARYRTDLQEGLLFQVDQSPAVFLGSVESDLFTDARSNWTETDGQMELLFAVGNGTGEQAAASADQNVRLRVMASLGAWSEDSTGTINLTVGERTYTATATRITDGTTLYAEFGDGWVFRFLDESGNELFWELPGGEMNYIEMRLHFESGTIQDTSLLQLQAIGEIQ